MENKPKFQVGDIVEILQISDFQSRVYLKGIDIKQFIGKRYVVSFIGKMIELEGFPPCQNCTSYEPTPFFTNQLKLAS